MGIPRRTHLECYADALKALEREKAKSERLRAALVKHGRHDDDCNIWNVTDDGQLHETGRKCTCGFSEALE